LAWKSNLKLKITFALKQRLERNQKFSIRVKSIKVKTKQSKKEIQNEIERNVTENERPIEPLV